MRTISKAVAGWTLGALLAVAGAWAASGIPMKGDYGKVSWTTWVGKEGYSGYLFVTRQPNRTTYLYYRVQCGNEPPVTGYGLIPDKSLLRNGDSELVLSVDTSQLRGFPATGSGAAGTLNVTWKGKNSQETVHAGASGTQMGSINEVTQGTWTSSTASATGTVLSWDIGAEQSAEMGLAIRATNQVSAAK